MLDRVKELLTQHNISKNQPLPITNGASGAFIYDIDGKYVAKHVRKLDNNSKTYNMFEKEYDFYRICSDKCYDFLPYVIFQTRNEKEMFIVMKKYTPIKHNEWNDNLLKQAMQLCARINSLDINNFDGVLQDKNDYGADYNAYPLAVSYNNWCLLQNKFPELIDDSLLDAMYKDFHKIDTYAKQLPIPQSLCHGDFHPENFLIDDNKLIICDWQTVGISKGIGDVAFFISRGVDMGIPINQNMIIEEYCLSMQKYTNEKIILTDLYKNIAASDFYVSFKFWAEHLQSSDEARVSKIYNSMVNSYKTMIH